MATPPPSRIPVLAARRTATRQTLTATPTVPKPRAPDDRATDAENVSPLPRGGGKRSPVADPESARRAREMHHILDRFLDLDLRDQLAVVREPVSPGAERRMILELSPPSTTTAPATSPSQVALVDPEVPVSPSRRLPTPPVMLDESAASAQALEETTLWLLMTVYNVHHRPATVAGVVSRR